MPEQTLPEFVGLKHVADALRVTRACLYTQCRKGKLPPFDVPKKRAGCRGVGALWKMETLRREDPTLAMKVDRYLNSERYRASLLAD